MHTRSGACEDPPRRSLRHGDGEALAGGPGPGPESPLAPIGRWRREFPGHQRELSALRRWLSSLLPQCPARDDVLSVASELGSNALEHTASGNPGGWFAVEITWHPKAVLVAVADCGGPAQPRVIDDPDGERGRGLLLVKGLTVRTGWTGDGRGRLVWAQVAWLDPNPAVPDASHDPYQAAVREAEAALARRFAGVPAWFGRSTLAWWAVAGPAGLVSAPTAQELAGLLCRLLDSPEPAQPPPAEQAGHREASGLLTAQPRRRCGSGGGLTARSRYPMRVLSLVAAGTV
jgi:anti-sigma regulatory factor (Ser/Thr protein kinase)